MVSKSKTLYNENLNGITIYVRCWYDPKSNLIKIYHSRRIPDYRHHKRDVAYDIHKNTSTCELLKQHADELKNDPERLSTEFLQILIGRGCKK